MKENYKFIIKLGVILFLIVSISTLALSVVNFVTEDIIIRKNAELQDNARKNVLTEADSFEIVENYNPLSEYVGEIYIAYKGNEKNGYCINISPNGYGGKIEMIVGINDNFTVSGVNIISMSETAGLGANSTKPEFLDQYKGKTQGVSVVKSPSDDTNTINAISGATITSKAVTEGVNLAIAEAKNLKEVVK